MTETSQNWPELARTGLCGWILKLKPSVIDEASIRAIVGPGIARTLAEVGSEFGLSTVTIKTNWRGEGMPGDPGRFPLADILLWRLRREAEHAKKNQSLSRAESASKRQEEADARKTELQVEKLELEMAEAAGIMINREVAGTAFRSILAELAECSSTIGDEMETEFPLEVAKEKVATINRKFARLLQAAAEKGARVIPPPRAAP